MRKTTVALFAALTLGGTLAAQTVIPTGYATTEGPSYHWGVGRYSPCRSAYYYAKKLMPAAPYTIKSFKLRADSKNYVGGHKYDIEVWMANSPNDPVTGYTMSFVANRGADYTKVMKRTSISFPAATSKKPEPFKVLFPMTTPFTYKGKCFQIEFKTFGTAYSYKTWYADAVYYTGTYTSPGYGKTYAGSNTGCPSNFTIYPGTTGARTGGLFYVYGYTRISKKATPVLDVLGTNDKKWGASTLPLDLTPYGAPGCSLGIDIVMANATISDPTSSSGFTYSVWGATPNDPSMVGCKVYNQWFAVDPGFNKLGLRASRYAWSVFADGNFKGKMDALAIYTYGNSGGHIFTGDEGAARFYTTRALVIELSK